MSEANPLERGLPMRNILGLPVLVVVFAIGATSAVYATTINDATGSYASPSGTDAPIALNQWYTLGFGGNVGSSFGSGAGFTLGTDPASIAAPAPTWTFTLPKGGTLTVVDGFLSGDQFNVTDFGSSLGDTSVPTPGASCGNNITACLQNPAMSKAVFALGAGTYAIDGTLIASSPVLGGAAFFEVTARTIPEPGTLGLLGTGVIGLALIAFRSKCQIHS